MHDIEFLICDVAILWRRAFSAHNKQLGISNIERRIMIQAGRFSGATQVEIANLIDIEPQNLIQPLDKLQAKGYIEKKSDTKDRRVKRIFLTPKSKSIMNKINAIGNSIRPAILGDMSTNEVEKLMSQLLKMKNNLEEFLQNK
ncbi:MAG TPA: MarR family transcriptional regulator [Gammaproteobacteria bacterium]|nr:MarR family transcriptional regulator [Gammaproteobacteria bacterium]